MKVVLYYVKMVLYYIKMVLHMKWPQHNVVKHVLPMEWAHRAVMAFHKRGSMFSIIICNSPFTIDAGAEAKKHSLYKKIDMVHKLMPE